MKNQKILTIIFAVFILAIAIFAIGRIGFNIEIVKEVPAIAIVNGTEMTDTIITIDGNMKKTYFPTKCSFLGTFAMDYYEHSCKDGVEAMIRWKDGYQSINFSYKGSFSRMDVESIEIDEQMEHIKVVFLDGTIIQTKS